MCALLRPAWLRLVGPPVIRKLGCLCAAGMALATLFVTMPFVARELIPILEAMDMAQEEAARTLGASDFEVGCVAEQQGCGGRRSACAQSQRTGRKDVGRVPGKDAGWPGGLDLWICMRPRPLPSAQWQLYQL